LTCGSEIERANAEDTTQYHIDPDIMFTSAAAVISENVNGVSGTRKGEKNVNEVGWHGL
jgi:hypothetical protein